MGAGDDLDTLGKSRVASDLAMVVAIGAHQLGKHLRVARIGLRSRQCVPIPISRCCFRVDRVHDVTGLDERVHPQTSIGLNPNDHVAGISCVSGDEVMELGHSLDALRQSSRRQLRAGFIAHVDVVMSLGPIIANEYHADPPRNRGLGSEPEGHPARSNGSVLEARHPIGAIGNPHQPTGARSELRDRVSEQRSAHRKAARSPHCHRHTIAA